MKLKKDKELLVISWTLLIIFFVSHIKADQLIYNFKSPSFSGINTSSHYLTIENQEATRKATIKEEIKAYTDAVS